MSHNLETPAEPRFQNLAPPPPVGPLVQRTYRGETVTLYEWRCSGEAHDSARDEWSDAYEVVVPRRGVFIFQVEGGEVFADRTSAAFFHPDQTYRVRHPLPGGDAGSVFRLDATAVAALVAEPDAAARESGKSRFPASGAPLDGRGYLLHLQAMRAMHDPGASRLELEERAIAFVREALLQADRRASPPSGTAQEYARRVQEVVTSRYREALTLAQVARAVEASPFHLSRLVKAATGVPIHRMIVRLRLRDALELLLETRESIAFVALSTGFASHSHLTDAFRREYGMAPSAIRARRPRTGFRRART